MSKIHSCITLWLLMIIVMILHFNYHVGEIFYGIDVVRPSATGEVPMSTHIIRAIYYHLPILWVLTLMYFDAKWVRASLFGLSVLYALSHGMHLFKELASPDISQISLLSIALLASTILSIEHFKLIRENYT